MQQLYTIAILSESDVSLIVRVTTMILRRRIHIPELEVSTIEPDGLYMIKISVTATGEEIRKLVLQIDKQVGVFKTFYDPDSERLDSLAESHRNKIIHDTNRLELLPSEAI